MFGLVIATIALREWYGPLGRHVTLRVAHAPGMPGTFSPPPRVSDPDMHHCTCVTHVTWCMPGTLTSSFLWSRWRGKRSRHSHVRLTILSIWLEAHALLFFSPGGTLVCLMTAKPMILDVRSDMKPRCPYGCWSLYHLSARKPVVKVFST